MQAVEYVAGSGKHDVLEQVREFSFDPEFRFSIPRGTRRHGTVGVE